MIVKFFPNEKGNPPGKLADCELHFTEGVAAGLKLIGFGIWERRNGGGRNVTFPCRQYSVNGERRSFALLRPIADVAGLDRLRDLILAAFEEWRRAEREFASCSQVVLPVFDVLADLKADLLAGARLMKGGADV
jgi:hypothetical protein